MDKCFKQIIWMSWSLRSRALFLNSNKRSRIIYNSSQNYWNSSKEIYRSVKLESVKKILDESSVMTLNDTRRILDSINNESALDLDDIFNVLSIIAKTVTDEEKEFNLRDHEGFKGLCDQLQKQIRFMTLQDILKSIKLLKFLNIPSNTMIMQSLLQIIKSNINHLDLNQVHLLISVLKKMEYTPLSSTLLVALPMLLPHILTTKLDYSDLKELSLALFYMKYVNDNNIAIKIYENIQSVMIYDSKSASVLTLKNMFISLSMLSSKKPFIKENKKTLELVREALFQNINKLTPFDIQECMKEISRSFMDKLTSDSYNVTFVNELLNVAISKNADFITCCNIGRYLNNIRFVYLPFVEFLINKLSRKKVMEQVNSNNLKEILQILSNAEYQSIPWLLLEDKLLEDTFLDECPVKILLKFGVHLAVLNKFYFKLLSKVFSTTDLKLLIRRNTQENNIHSKRFLFLYQSVKSLYPHYTDPWPNKSVFHLINNTSDAKFINKLRLNLEQAMGGPQYVISYLKTKLGHNINHAVIMRKGGYPIAFNTHNSSILANYTYFVEDLHCEPNSHVIILIMEYSPLSYSINTQQLLGVWKSELRCIEKWTGHKCVPININEWLNLPTYEKNKYIMQEIKNKCSDILEIS